MIIDKCHEMKMLTRQDGEMIYGSPSITTILGYTLQEFINSSVFDIIFKDDIPEFMENRRRIFQTPGKSFYFKHRRLHKNGNVIWCEGTVTNMLHTPCVNTLVSIFHNISESNLEEQKEELDRINLNDLKNKSNDLMWSLEKDANSGTGEELCNEIGELTFANHYSKESTIISSRLSRECIKLYKEYFERTSEVETFTKINYADFPFEVWSEISV